MLSPVELLLTRENLAALNVLVFLCQLVGAAANHLSSIPKKPFYPVSVHGLRDNALALYHTVDVHDCDVSQQ